MDSSLELLEKDMVQFHAPQYRSLRKVRSTFQVNYCTSPCPLVSIRVPCIDLHPIVYVTFFVQDVLGCTQDMDFILWPRNDLEGVTCFLFSRWKGDSEAEFQHIDVCYASTFLCY